MITRIAVRVGRHHPKFAALAIQPVNLGVISGDGCDQINRVGSKYQVARIERKVKLKVKLIAAKGGD
ncbi:MAG: hypothetical protein K8I30_05325, partial [Anaerolineae bacterium]|nr:hypothetical protein [Anaerolineae bacterium]